MDETSKHSGGIAFSVLGTLQVTVDGVGHHPRGPKTGRLLALLALRAGRPVSTEELVDELWGECPPGSAVGTLHTHVYNLRRQLAFLQGPSAVADDRLLATAPNGYLLRAPAHSVDARRFADLVAQGRRRLRHGQPEAAQRSARLALSLWRDRPLVGLAVGQPVSSELAHLDELRVQALRTCVEAQLRCGSPADTVPELRALVAAHPLDEWFHGRLIEALWASGRRGAALEAVQRVRRILADELGLEPSAEIRRLHSAILAGVLAGRSPGTAAAA
ncbi:AfsR/SARP family transcriptional regulator [Streptomyces flaveolus]|uniref:AfsR/SARP family transcriptional regulator n=1 Tax=Streptomyces flaveolus TaxID=67297 RepID=UPI0033EA7776